VVAIQPVPSTGPADEPHDYFRIGLMGGYATSTGRHQQNDMAGAAGLWATRTFGRRFSLGAEGIFYFGTSQDYQPGPYTVKVSNLYLGLRVGVDLTDRALTITPYLLVGGAIEYLSCNNCPGHEANPVRSLAGGVGGLVHVTVSAFLLGVDARVLYVGERGFTGAVFGTIGFRIR
jgi:hypothetical protein